MSMMKILTDNLLDIVAFALLSKRFLTGFTKNQQNQKKQKQKKKLFVVFRLLSFVYQELFNYICLWTVGERWLKKGIMHFNQSPLCCTDLALILLYSQAWANNLSHFFLLIPTKSNLSSIDVENLLQLLHCFISWPSHWNSHVFTINIFVWFYFVLWYANGHSC